MKDVFRKQLWISVGVILGSIIAAAVGLYLISGDISFQADKIIATRTLTAQQTDALANFAKLKKDAPQATQYQTAMAQLLPTKYQLVNFPRWVGDLARKYQVTANAALQGVPSDASPGTAGSNPFTLDVQGSTLSAVLGFIQDLESKAPGYLLSVNSFDFTNDQGTVRATLRGSLFFR